MFVCIGCGGPHHLRVPEEFAAGRFFGSYPPGWVFLAGAQVSEHALINLYTRARLLIPDFHTMTGDATRQPRQMVMVAAALSAEPLAPGKACFGAAIVHTLGGAPVFALWALVRAARHERPVAHGFHITVGEGAGAGHQQLFLEDVAYHRGAFYFLTRQEQLVAVHVVDGGERLLARQQLIEHRRPANPQGLLVSGRYLLASRGGWTMVVRYHWPPLPGDREPGPARRLTMYRGEIHHGDAFTTWMELQPESLQGLLVFAARGCSRLIEDPSGLHNLPAGVRYLDDRDARDMDMIQGGDPSLRHYRCNDTCGFGWPPAAIHFYATWVNYPPSTYSSPIWFFP
ncbi:hypothetical protein CFC21_013902 [Triticum aestivum]|uniref:KIB1-4 beta-propeller domain-containing protein n=2 Tax=Triticum aestivum TaxID=4565 RepID=A0A9R1IYJ5_WHEAT|nr:hypothetical protein CFC21_013902 [Triticum aestivum]